ncbi:hypothetical protein C1G87_0360 [Dehalococcoides mccartyi]|uniref:Uncharacterized protein n=1 Tax=Dehalococcoides mccartyi TaxID=61435 RepID=A0A142V9Z0_9CHLR|nr:hypothetical protein Dm11a5_0330 [Dehalococcoides mccartyi]AOV98996.1 hypothetical protein DCWBC2_0329 [Dehalococcoides mccartyi]MBA2084768.1 hypothetical protein [Dehalococcoides mccartyi]RAL69411.1 hypothetical protein C1G87_0360 [Dehalococcoides mccartyi]
MKSGIGWKAFLPDGRVFFYRRNFIDANKKATFSGVAF